MNQELNPKDPLTQDNHPSRKLRQFFNLFMLRLLPTLRRFWPILFPAAALTALIFALIIAPDIGCSVGVTVGSFEGVTQGIAQGIEEGADAGLSAADTAVKIGTELSKTGKLEILLLNFQLSDIYEEGAGPQYAALFSMRGDGIFAVDLTESTAESDPAGGQIIIWIPYPEFEPYLDDSTVEIVAEYEAPLFNGTTESGYKGWLNSRKEIAEKVQSEMIAYDVLVERAETSALRQIELLAKSICGDSFNVEVRFIGEEG